MSTTPAPDSRSARLRNQAADALAERIRSLVGTGDFLIVDIAFTYLQARDLTDEEATGLHVELASNSFLPKHRALSREAEDSLRELGFMEPERNLPNWYVMFGYQFETPEITPDEFDDAIDAVARSVVDAFVDVYLLSPEMIAGALGVKLPTRRATASHSPRTGRDGLIAHKRLDQLMADYAATVRADRAAPYATPWESGTSPLFFGIVDHTEHGQLLDLVALAPSRPSDAMPCWWQFVAGGWVLNPFVPDMVARDRGRRLRPLDADQVKLAQSELLAGAGITVAA